ncbi:hypothetical protein AB0J84_28400 [Micromonospora arborensis]|uniref:hypothetical protein n=1 Tax=Micromonospora arborensis TaxID=2116518 RepID=UPI0034161C5B
MKPPSKLCTTRYRPLIAGRPCGARLGDRVTVGPTDGLPDGDRDPATALGGSPLARPDNPGSTGAGDDADTDVGALGAATADGSGNAGGTGAPSGAGLRPRYAPKATKSRTTITTTPAPTTIQGDETIATGPCGSRGPRRMPNMNLPQRTVRAA